jgi:hypothetical protein
MNFRHHCSFTLIFFYSFVGDPCCDGVFDGSGEVAFSPAVFRYGRESERFLQVIGEDYTDASHVRSPYLF